MVGTHPDSGSEIKAHIGRYGPYVQHGKVYASLTGEDDVLTVELPRALELLAKKAGKSKALRTIGEHPESGEPLEILEGRYGPYIKYQKINASLPKGTDLESVTMDQALELIAAKAAAKGKKKTTRRKKKK